MVSNGNAEPLRLGGKLVASKTEVITMFLSKYSSLLLFCALGLTCSVQAAPAKSMKQQAAHIIAEAKDLAFSKYAWLKCNYEHTRDLARTKMPKLSKSFDVVPFVAAGYNGWTRAAYDVYLLCDSYKRYNNRIREHRDWFARISPDVNKSRKAASDVKPILKKLGLNPEKIQTVVADNFDWDGGLATSEHIVLGSKWNELNVSERDFLLAHEGAHIADHATFKKTFGPNLLNVAAMLLCEKFVFIPTKRVSQSAMAQGIDSFLNGILMYCLHMAKKKIDLPLARYLEKSADLQAVKALDSNRGGIKYFERVREREIKETGAELPCTTHPTPTQRIAYLEKWDQKNHNLTAGAA